jgi:hypothetical protein
VTLPQLRSHPIFELMGLCLNEKRLTLPNVILDLNKSNGITKGTKHGD